MPKDHSLTYIDLHPQPVDTESPPPDLTTIEEIIMWILIWLFVLAVLGSLAFIASALYLS